MNFDEDDETFQNAQLKNYFEHQMYQTNQFEEEMSMIQKAALIVNDVTDLLCSEISHGIIEIQDQERQLPVEKKPLTKSQYLKLQLQQVDVEEHRRKVKTLMQANRRFRQRLNNQTLQFENSLKKSQQGERRMKQSQKQNQIQKRRSLIERRMASKSQMIAKIRQMSIQSNERFKGVRKQKFLYEEKQEEFKSKVLLPKLQEQKKILQKRKETMKTMDIKGLIEHQKSYYEKKRTHSINRSMTSRIMKSETFYEPPQFVPKSYQIYEAEERIRKQQQMMRIKEAEINKKRVKQYIKNVSEIHKLEKDVTKSHQISPQQIDIQQIDIKMGKNKKVKVKVKELSKKELTDMGNSYFEALKEQLKSVKQKRDKRAKQKQEELKRIKQEQQKDRSIQDELQIQIRSESIRTVQKIEKIQRSYKIRSKKIQSIFNDTTIDPLFKYQKLKHEMDNFDMVLKTKNHQSEDIKERTEAAGCYMNAIRAKLKLLEVSASK